MNRLIRFRAWVPHVKEMHFVKGIEFNGEGPKWVTLVGMVDRGYRAQGGLKRIEKLAASRVELMQATGVKDSMGIEIFEGDIVRCLMPKSFRNEAPASTLYAVIFEDGAFVLEGRNHYEFDGAEGYEHDDSMMHSIDDDMTIMGNIYEYAHLVEAAS